MNNIDLKCGDVIHIEWDDEKHLAIFDKVENNKLHIYIEMVIDGVREGELYFKLPFCDYTYDFKLNNFTYRLATDNEKTKLYNLIGKHFTEEYDKDWYNHFTDSSYFDIQDYLFSVFGIEVGDYDDDLIYPDFINEIHTYIWDKLCKSMNVTDTDVNKPEMVNKQEFIEKAKKWLKNNMRVKTTSYSDVWDVSEIDQVVSDFYTIEEMINSFCKTMED